MFSPSALFSLPKNNCMASHVHSLTPIIDHLKTELQTVRSGRANPSLIEGIPITAYQSTMKLVELASITTPEPRTLVIQPWDTALLKDIERGMAGAKLDLQPIVEGDHIRLTLPSLTEERRQEYMKLAREKTERARISLRRVRDDLLRELRDAEREAALSEDAAAREKKIVEDEMKTANESIDQLLKDKETELLTV